MSEYSISSPGQELTVEYLPSGVVYAATEDLPATARQVMASRPLPAQAVRSSGAGPGPQHPTSISTSPGTTRRRRSPIASVAGPSARWRSTT